MREYESRIKLKFKFLAKFYDLCEIPFGFRPDTNPRLALAGKIPNEGLRILDTCVGTANSALAFAQANNLNEIVGIDLSEDMLAVAEAKIRKRAIRNISLQQMDATRMSFRDGEFDIVMISFALHELDYELMMRILKEMSRVVKPNGKLYIIDYEREENLLPSLFLSILLKVFEPSHMQRFLQYDWNKILGELGFQVVGKEKYLFSKLISAVRGSTL